MKLNLNQAICNISRLFSESKILDYRSIVVFLLLSTSLITNAQNSAHFIALDNNGDLYDVDPSTCSNVQLNICSNVPNSLLSIALSGNILYVVDNKGKLYKQTYNSSGNCTLIGTFPTAIATPSLASGYYGLTVDSNGKVYAATGGNIDTYNPNTNSFTSLNGTLPSTWKIGGDLIFYGGQLFMACKNLDLVKINISNIANSTAQFSFDAGSQIFGLASVSVPCANNQVYAIDNINNTTTNILSLNMTSGTVDAIGCSLPFRVYDTASIAETGSYVAPLAPNVVVTQPSCSSNTATLKVSPILTGYTYSIDGINFTNTTGIFSGILAGTNYSIKAKDALGCISNPTTGTVNAIPASITPTFNPIPTVCLNSIAPILPTSSTNVPPISGTWNSVISSANIGTTNYTFTPDSGQCGISTTLPVTVENCGFGTFASAAWLSNCNVPNGQFYNITGSGADLINPGSPAGSFITNLGTFIQNSGSLTFGGGEIKTFKSTIGNVCGATMFYNIHPQGIAAGTFAPLLLDFFSNCNSGSFTGGGPCSPRDQKWQTVNGGLVVDMTKFPSGNYVLEVYYTVNGDNNSSSQCDDTTILNNAGANYLSTFSIQGTPNYSSTNPSTCSGTEGTITISSLLANTNYTLSYKDDGVVVGPSSVTSNASGSIVISGLNAGTYSNFIVAVDCGNYTNNSPIVLVNPALSASISKVDNSVCQSTSVPCNGSATVVSSGSGSYSYLWDDALGQTSATATALCPGTYSVTITDLVSLCTLSRSITVVNTAVLPVLSSLSPVTSPICSGGNAVFTLSGTANASVTYTINGGVSQIVNLGTSGNTSVSVNQASSDVTIVLSQISLGSCSAALTNTATVIVSSPPNAGILNGLQTVCVNGTTTFSSTVNGGLWSSLDTSIATVDAFGVVTGISNGTATINYTVLGTGGCTSSAIATRTVTVSSSSVTITAGCVDTNYTLVASTSDTNVTYKWYKGATLLNETSNNLIVTQADTYKVIVNNGGCLSETTENVTFLYCDIPKGISPNNDQKNDFFDLTNFQVSKLEIFNRYGMKVYGKANYKKEWDGKTDSGQELPDATYYYVIEFESGKSKTGWVYINRQQ